MRKTQRKAIISSYLLYGRENAKTAAQLAVALNCRRRDISARIERERRQGQPICASSDPVKPGYYLAETAEELQEYCHGLRRRAGEIFKTRQALLKAAEEMREQEQQEAL